MQRGVAERDSDPDRVCTLGIWLLWAYLPEETLFSFGIHYFPSRYVDVLRRSAVSACHPAHGRVLIGTGLWWLTGWDCRWWTLAIPAWLCITYAMVPLIYYSINFMRTPSLDSTEFITGTSSGCCCGRGWCSTATSAKCTRRRHPLCEYAQIATRSRWSSGSANFRSIPRSRP